MKPNELFIPDKYSEDSEESRIESGLTYTKYIEKPAYDKLMVQASILAKSIYDYQKDGRFTDSMLINKWHEWRDFLKEIS